MIAWGILICAAVIMYRVAEYEKRSGALWAAITVGLGLLLSFTFPGIFGLFAGIAALVMAYTAMFILNWNTPNY